MSELIANLEVRLAAEHDPRPGLGALKQLNLRIAQYVDQAEYDIGHLGPMQVRKTPEGWVLSQAIFSAPAVPAGAPPEKPCEHPQCPSHLTVSESAPTEAAHHPI